MWMDIVARTGQKDRGTPNRGNRHGPRDAKANESVTLTFTERPLL